jgi:hypothetical protein
METSTQTKDLTVEEKKKLDKRGLTAKQILDVLAPNCEQNINSNGQPTAEFWKNQKIFG